MVFPHDPRKEVVVSVQRSILVVDDHELIRLGLAHLIGSRPEWKLAGLAATAADAMQLARRERPDLAIVDLRLGGGDGLELVRQLRTSLPATRALVFSMQDESLYADRCLRAGAHGYVCKHEPAATLVAAIEQALNGAIYLSPGMTATVLARSAHGDAMNESPLASLSDRELEVYELIGSGMSVKEIARHLHLSPKTIEYHRQHIKEKLALGSSAALARHATSYALEQT